MPQFLLKASSSYKTPGVLYEPKLKNFEKKVWDYYRKNGRHNLPWRKTRNPYRILVSEIMLQQTQVDRVIPYYKNFLTLFPTPQKLAQAKISDVLRSWQGLGYNRRALYLHRTAQLIRGSASYQLKLHGVGEYTKKAISVFAFNKPEVLIETNIRTVFLHHFFPISESIHDRELIRIVERTLDRKNPREWYWALMDYGAYIKKTLGNQNSRSKHYLKQSKFAGSLRQERGRLLKELLKKSLSEKDIREEKTRRAIGALIKEGMVQERNKKYTLSEN